MLTAPNSLLPSDGPAALQRLKTSPAPLSGFRIRQSPEDNEWEDRAQKLGSGSALWLESRGGFHLCKLSLITWELTLCLTWSNPDTATRLLMLRGHLR